MSLSVLLLSSCFKEEEFVVTFDTQGGSFIASKTIKVGEDLILPSNPRPNKNEDSFFDGWYFDKEYTQPYSSIEPISTNLTLFAKWVKIENKIEYNPTYLTVFPNFYNGNVYYRNKFDKDIDQIISCTTNLENSKFRITEIYLENLNEFINKVRVECGNSIEVIYIVSNYKDLSYGFWSNFLIGNDVGVNVNSSFNALKDNEKYEVFENLQKVYLYFTDEANFNVYVKTFKYTLSKHTEYKEYYFASKIMLIDIGLNYEWDCTYYNDILKCDTDYYKQFEYTKTYNTGDLVLNFYKNLSFEYTFKNERTISFIEYTSDRCWPNIRNCEILFSASRNSNSLTLGEPINYFWDTEYLEKIDLLYEKVITIFLLITNTYELNYNVLYPDS